MNSDFEKFNMYLKRINEQFKGKRPLYAIAFYDMYDFKYITGEISDNIEEIKKIYDEKYSWKPNQVGVTEYHFEIVEVNFKQYSKEKEPNDIIKRLDYMSDNTYYTDENKHKEDYSILKNALLQPSQDKKKVDAYEEIKTIIDTWSTIGYMSDSEALRQIEEIIMAEVKGE